MFNDSTITVTYQFLDVKKQICQKLHNYLFTSKLGKYAHLTRIVLNLKIRRWITYLYRHGIFSPSNSHKKE